MDIESNFHVKILPAVKAEDLPDLSREMTTDLLEVFVPILESDPYNCCELFPSHDLVRELNGWRAMEIERDVDGYREVYRLVYKIVDTPKDKTVTIAAFHLHDPAYDRAKERVVQGRR